MKKKNILIIVMMLIISILFTIVIKTVDLDTIGPENSVVGFSSLNGWFHELTGYNKVFYNISKYFGYLPLLSVPVYAIIGLLQLVKTKKLSKVNKELIYLGIFYVVVIAVYVFFEKVAVINYRPIILDEGLEASYPSSHTLMALCLCGAAIIINRKLYKNDKTKIVNIMMAVIALIVVVCRLLSGVHWLTDIVGGLLIATTLLYAFNCCINLKNK